VLESENLMAANNAFLPLMVVNFFFNAVIPNSYSVIAAFALILSFAIAIFQVEWTESLVRLIFLFFASATVTLTYIVVGIINGAPSIAAIQIALTYIVFPFIWIVVSANLLQTISTERFVNWSIHFSFIGIISVGSFFYLFLNYGSDSVLFFINSPNINLKDGYSQATMHVYGSFIFVTGAFFAAPRLLLSQPIRYLLLSFLICVAVTSGRSALIISIFIGLLVGALFLPRSSFFSTSRNNSLANLISSFVTKMFAFTAISAIVIFAVGIDLSVIMSSFTNKLLSGGGIERVEQADALLTSIKGTFGVGTGHGVGLTYVRNEEYPWRYELVWLATLHRVGIFGSIIYSLSFCMCIFIFLNRWRQHILSEFDVFLFSGFICALIASSTNPYIEAFSFQWMYIIPVVYFFSYLHQNDAK
jgi:hypothetical protein